MNLFPRRLEWQFQRNYRRHVFSNELTSKIQRMRECFSGSSSLPLPTAEVIAAWNDLPNETPDILPMPMKVNTIFLRAPPPTPTKVASDIDDATEKGASSDDGPHVGWPDFHDTDSLSLDFQDLGCSATSDILSMSRSSYVDQSSEQTSEGGSRSTESSSPSSSECESSSSGQDSRKPAEFRSMVNQWLEDYHNRGKEGFIESLIAFGVMSLNSAPVASRIARTVIRKVTKASYAEGKNLETAIRFSMLAAFKKHWNLSDAASAAPSQFASPHAINIASFMGSMFDAKVFDAKDVHLCLSLLLAGGKRYDRLCAMHALLIRANDKLCKTRNLDALMLFKSQIGSRDKNSGEYLWITGPNSEALITDILTTIEQWTVSQSLRRDPRRSAPDGDRVRRSRAVGPRLRNGFCR